MLCSDLPNICWHLIPQCDRLESQPYRRFVGHSTRALLSLLLLLGHLTELCAAVLGRNVSAQLGAGAALLAWVASQFLCARAETHREPRYLLLSTAFWLACGLVRGIALHRALDGGLGTHHVTPLAAAAVSTLCYALAVCDVIAVVSEVGRTHWQTSSCQISQVDWQEYVHVIDT